MPEPEIHTVQDLVRAVGRAEAFRPQHQRLRTRKAKKGPPSRAVTTPTGSS